MIIYLCFKVGDEMIFGLTMRFFEKIVDMPPFWSNKNLLAKYKEIFILII